MKGGVFVSCCARRARLKPGLVIFHPRLRFYWPPHLRYCSRRLWNRSPYFYPHKRSFAAQLLVSSPSTWLSSPLARVNMPQPRKPYQSCLSYRGSNRKDKDQLVYVRERETNEERQESECESAIQCNTATAIFNSFWSSLISLYALSYQPTQEPP